MADIISSIEVVTRGVMGGGEKGRVSSVSRKENGKTDGFPEVTRSDNNFIPPPRMECEFSPQLLVSPEALIAFNTNYLLLEASVVKRNTILPVGKKDHRLQIRQHLKKGRLG